MVILKDIKIYLQDKDTREVLELSRRNLNKENNLDILKYRKLKQPRFEYYDIKFYPLPRFRLGFNKGRKFHRVNLSQQGKQKRVQGPDFAMKYTSGFD